MRNSFPIYAGATVLGSFAGYGLFKTAGAALVGISEAFSASVSSMVILVPASAYAFCVVMDYARSFREEPQNPLVVARPK